MLRRSPSIFTNGALQCPVLAYECMNLVKGPAHFTRHNLLKDLEFADPSLPCHRLKLMAGTADSFCPGQVAELATDTYSYLREGRQLWLVAPPEQAVNFNRVFTKELALLAPDSIAAGVLVDECRKYRVEAVMLNEGDTIHVPGGWSYCIQNLTDTVTIGGSYLRAWHLNRTMKWADADSTPDTRTFVDRVLQTAKEGEWGITSGELRAFEKAWEDSKKKKKGLGNKSVNSNQDDWHAM